MGKVYDWFEERLEVQAIADDITSKYVPPHVNIFYCFGHHHLGWTLGPISGKIISGMIAEENTNLDLKPYSSIRFS